MHPKTVAKKIRLLFTVLLVSISALAFNPALANNAKYKVLARVGEIRVDASTSRILVYPADIAQIAGDPASCITNPTWNNLFSFEASIIVADHLLSVLLNAKATRARVWFVGNGNCTGAVHTLDRVRFLD